MIKCFYGERFHSQVNGRTSRDVRVVLEEFLILHAFLLKEKSLNVGTNSRFFFDQPFQISNAASLHLHTVFITNDCVTRLRGQIVTGQFFFSFTKSLYYVYILLLSFIQRMLFTCGLLTDTPKIFLPTSPQIRMFHERRESRASMKTRNDRGKDYTL